MCNIRIGMLRSIPKAVAERILDKIGLLSDNPLPKGVSKITSSEYLYRFRVGDYRIIYSIDHNDRLITIQYIRHRKESYNRL
jgi:mRNA interferase RelE/StbE